MKRRMLLAVLVCLTVAVVSDTAFGALTAYLKIKGEKGEATDKDHKDWIIIESWGSRAPALPTAAQGKGGAGQFSIKHVANIEISPAILRLMISKQTFDMSLDVMEGSKLVHYIIYGCAISGYSFNRSGRAAVGYETHELEDISFKYQRIERSK